MCFSASASFTASALLLASGIAALTRVRKKNQIMFATIPLIFALQQATEGLLWLSFSYNWPLIQTIVTYLFLLIAGSLWPIWTPLSLWLMEQRQSNKNSLKNIIFLGMAFGLYILIRLIIGGASAHAYTHHITYITHMIYQGPYTIVQFLSSTGFLAWYSLATVYPFFISTIPYMWLGGVAISIAYAISYFFYYESIGSVWCFCVALISLGIVGMLHYMNKEHR